MANTNWSTNFDAAALADPDGDGTSTWQEYIAGTDPLNSTSAFSVSITSTNGRQIVSFPTIATTARYGLSRYYALESCTNLVAPVWQGIGDLTNVRANGQLVLWTNTLLDANIFIRGRVWLAP